MHKKSILAGIVVGVLLTSVTVALAGNLDPPATPDDPSSQMYTLEDIYKRLSGQGNAVKMTAFTEPTSGPGSTMHTLDDIYHLAWPARVHKTGQSNTYAAGDDGELGKGVAWPNPRFTDNSNGTVTDNLTGLVWLKDADCVAFFVGDTTGQNDRPWTDALTAANSLASGHCGLTDSSSVGDWRLPNVRELYSLVDFDYHDPPVPNTTGTGQWSEGNPFTGLQSYGYWSSSTSAHNTAAAFVVSMGVSSVHSDSKAAETYTYYVWPVRNSE